MILTLLLGCTFAKDAVDVTIPVNTTDTDPDTDGQEDTGIPCELALDPTSLSFPPGGVASAAWSGCEALSLVSCDPPFIGFFDEDSVDVSAPGQTVPVTGQCAVTPAGEGDAALLNVAVE